MRVITRLVVTAAIVSTGALTGAAADASVLAPTLSVAPASVEAGQQITISGTGWTCVDPVLSIGTDPVTDLGVVATDETGAFELTTAAPTTPGTYTVSAVDGECRVTETATFAVMAPATTTTTTTTTTLAPTTTTLAPTTTVAVTTTVAAATTTTLGTGAVLPETGRSDGRLVLIGLVALLVGAGLVTATRRPRTS